MLDVAIIGSRDYDTPDAVLRFVDGLAAKYPEVRIVSGGARGPDSLAALRAKSKGLRTLEYIPTKIGASRYVIRVLSTFQGEVKDDFNTGEVYFSYGASAFARNRMIVKAAARVVAFWDGESRGTKNSLDIAQAFNRPAYIYGPGGSRKK